MAFLKRKQAIENLRLDGSGGVSRHDEMLEAQVNGELGAYFHFEGPAIARARDAGSIEFPVSVSGYFAMEDLVPGMEHEGFSQFSELIEVQTFVASDGVSIKREDGQQIDPEDFCSGGQMVLCPTQTLTVPLDAVLVSEDDVEELAKNLGINVAGQAAAAAIDPRERDNLNKLIGVLVHIHVADNPGRYEKGSGGQLSIERLAKQILEHMDLLGIEDTGLKLRSLKDKIDEALKLVDDLR